MATIKGWTWNPEDHTANSHFPLMVNFVYRCKRKTKPVWHSYCSSVTHKALLWHKCPRCFDPLVHHFYLLGLLGAGFHLLYNFGNKKKATRIMHRWSAILYPPQRVHNWNPLNKTTEVDVGKLYHKECMRQTETRDKNMQSKIFQNWYFFPVISNGPQIPVKTRGRCVKRKGWIW